MANRTKTCDSMRACRCGGRRNRLGALPIAAIASFYLIFTPATAAGLGDTIQDALVPPTPNTTISVTEPTMTAFAAAIDEAGVGVVTKIVLPEGATIPVTSYMSRDITGKTIVIDQNGARFEYRRKASIRLTGSHEMTVPVNALSVSGGKTVMQLPSIPDGWKAGDIVKVYSLDDPLPGARLPDRRMGELMEIESIDTSSTAVAFTEQLACQSCYTQTLRAAKVNRATVWWLRPDMSGDLSFRAAQLRLETLYQPRIIEPKNRLNGWEFIALINNWKPIVWEPDLAEGRADTELGFWTYGVKLQANKHALIEGSGTKVNCRSIRHCIDPQGIAPSSDNPAFYGPDLYTVARKLNAVDMLAASWGTHAEGWGHRMEQLTSHGGSHYCITLRGRGHVVDHVTCDDEKGIQIGVRNDGLAGDIEIRDSQITAKEYGVTPNPDVLLSPPNITIRGSVIRACSQPLTGADLMTLINTLVSEKC
jgi:hypothetical protein